VVFNNLIPLIAGAAR
jgi:hypothetical protein